MIFRIDTKLVLAQIRRIGNHPLAMSALEAMLVAQDAAAQGSQPDPTAHLELAGFAFPPSAGPSGEHRFLAHLKVREKRGFVQPPAAVPS